MNKLNLVDGTAEAVSITVSTNSTLIYVLNINWLDSTEFTYVNFPDTKRQSMCVCLCFISSNKKLNMPDYTFVRSV